MIQLLKHIIYGLLIISGGVYLYSLLFLNITFVKNSGENFFFLYLTLVYFCELLFLYGLFSIFKLIGFRFVIYSILGGFFIGSITFITTQYALWFVPLDDSIATIAAILGLLYGIILFPVFLKPLKPSTTLSK